MLERRKSLAKLLLDGPKRAGELQKEMGMPNASFFHALQCRWFAKCGYGQYRITAEGRTAITGKQAIP